MRAANLRRAAAREPGPGTPDHSSPARSSRTRSTLGLRSSRWARTMRASSAAERYQPVSTVTFPLICQLSLLCVVFRIDSTYMYMFRFLRLVCMHHSLASAFTAMMEGKMEVG